ncbi:MAG: hypothetical protein ACF8PN_04005 [Phycisphaerales bacterium]
MFTLAASLGATVLTSTAAAQFQTRVIAENLAAPTGIAYGGGTTLYFTEVPTPGVNGKNGGQNRVVSLDARTGAMFPISEGEPEPVNLAYLSGRDMVLWTCKSAGVILGVAPGHDPEMIVTDLNEPVGIASIGDFVIFTEVPTPGVGGNEGGMNAVKVFDGVEVTTVDFGDPEPTDIAVSTNGTLYWTCKSAGVIVRKPLNEDPEVILDDLASPTGIALDRAGRVYFTEVPTPGVAGDDGGMNAVWRYTPDRGDLTLINFGDPEPTDITVIPSGRVVAWTCTSAGVIVAAYE